MGHARYSRARSERAWCAKAEVLVDKLATLSRTSLALARQIMASVPVLVHAADTLLRISDEADAAIATAIRDLMK